MTSSTLTIFITLLLVCDQVASSQTSTTRPGSVDDVNVRYIGRWDRSDPSVAHSYWGSAYLRASFTGTTLRVKVAKPCEMAAVVDGKLCKGVGTDGGKLVNFTTEPLPAGEHTLLLTAPGQNPEILFQGVVLDDGAVTKPVPERPFVEFVGDSITACAGKESPFDTNYAWMTGEAMGCDHTQIAFSGVALKSGYGFFGDKTGFDAYYFRLKNPYGKTSEPWSFSPAPMMVVVNLGTNDVLNGHRPSDEEFAKTYYDFLSAIRAKLPETKLIAMRPFGGFFERGIQSAVTQLHDHGDARVFYVDTTAWLEKADFSDGIHPTAAGHAKAAARLTDELTKIIKE